MSWLHIGFGGVTFVQWGVALFVQVNLGLSLHHSSGDSFLLVMITAGDLEEPQTNLLLQKAST